MIKTLLKILGWSLAHTPESLLYFASRALGWLMLNFGRSRREVMLRNLAAVFPERPDTWHRAIARASCDRLIETGLLSLASPYFSVERLRRMARLDSSAENYFREVAASPRPIVVGSAHLAYWEALTWLPAISTVTLPQLSTVYRPLRNPALNEWVVQTRSRFGVHLLSRKSGIHAGLHILRRNGLVNVLFDQNAGGHGSLTTFFGRPVSMTELPALLVEKVGADLRLLGTRRTAFWRVEIFIREAPHDATTSGMMTALNIAFERLLVAEPEICASWLWAHDRWKINRLPNELAKVTAKRNLLAEDAAFRARAAGKQ